MPKKKGKKRHHKDISKSSSTSSTSSSSSNNDTTKNANESIIERRLPNTSSSHIMDNDNDIDIESRYPASEQPISNRKATVSQFSSWNQAFQAAASITPHDLGKDYVDPSSLTNKNDDDVPFGSGNVRGISQIANEYLMIKSSEKSSSSSVEEKGDNHDDDVEMKSREDEKREDASPAKGKEEEEASSISPSKKKKKKKKDSKKKKKKSKSKPEDNDENGNGNGDTNTNNEEKDSVNKTDDNQDGDSQNLEGKMITHQNQSVMVLVDYQHNKVYSALNRNEDGNLIQVGIVGRNCEVEITNEKGLTASNVTAEDEIDPEFPFDVDPDDHCESPFQAYRDICPLLEELLRIEGTKTKDDFAIYDPYYCNGSVIQHLNELGFPNVYNKKEDCYQTWSKDDLDTLSSSAATSTKRPYPEYNAFITNPPYSGDHIEKLISHLTTDERTKGKPWFLLMPTFVHKKDYYKDKIATKSKDPKKASTSSDERKIDPFYLVPKKRYVYIPPKQFREKKLSDVHKKSSPFVSMWYVYGGTREKTDKLFKAYKKWQNLNNSTDCELARGKSALRDLRRKKK